MDEYPKDAFQKMAVLFTDIVGSTTYFKSHGNLAGRKMLQAHQDLVSKPIAEHDGIFVKTLGDSVMAYFINPREAVKSAIKIQQKFSVYNEKKAEEKQIHIRIGIHFGDAIVEESDIFGDAVNMAAKVVQVAESDQIFLSQELYDLVRDLSHGLFQLVDVSNKKRARKELTIYRILWQETIAFALTTNILLYLKPLLNLNKADFKEAWNSLLESKEGLWGGKIDKECVLSDKSVVLIVKEAPFSITVAKDVLVFLKKKIGKDYNPLPLPIQIIIDSGPYLSADKLAIEALEVNWDEIDPGEIYISPDAHRCVSATH
ncbi:MAG: adenylate/guanylate cyclase domain-containing protein, partial [Deltaproteobacteria bacterium]|nr:adenylate/guanylate cyclase domain-containing protein [Deltaproteobacteria bacterium]